ncbi:MAG TPA: pitrilysin family protein, partial [Pseudomonadales bacterium]|nr:pitrilysin family protein [Pseudomonadales bacterium]
RDMAVVELRTLTKPEWLNTALDTLTDVLVNPAFPKTNFERNRSLMQLNLEQQKEQPEAVAGLELNKLLYGNHPYGIPSDGTMESLKAIKIADIRQFYQRFYVAKNMTIAMVGSLNRAEAEKIAEQLSSGLPSGTPADNLPKPQLAAPGKHEKLNHPSTQAHLLIATLGLSREDEDEYYPLYVGNEILGGSGFSSLLNDEIRQKRGLSYSVGSGFTPMRQTGPFAISLQTKADQVGEAEKVVHETLHKFLQDGPTAEQVESAKRNIINSFPVSVSNNSGVVGYLGAMGFYDMPLDYLDNYLARIQAVTPEQIKAVFNKRVKENDLITVIVGP